MRLQAQVRNAAAMLVAPLMRNRFKFRVARAEDLERSTVHTEFRLEGSGHVDLRQDTESVLSERSTDG